MKFQNLSVKRLFGRVAIGFALSMSGITIALFLVTKQTAVLLTGGALLLCALAGIFVLTQAFGKRLSQFTADLCQTLDHVECVIALSKGEIDSKKVRVEFSLEGLDTSGLQKGATYPEIKARVLEQTGLKVSSLYISQVKQKCGLEVRENHHKAKSENTKQPQCPKEKEDAIVEALKHFQMI